MASAEASGAEGTPKMVCFWKPNKPNGFLSQWYSSPFAIKQADGKMVSYNCAEQYMMSMKAKLFLPRSPHKNASVYAQIMASSNPSEIKRLGSQVKGFSDAIWEAEREKIVYEGNYAKFSQNPILLKQLLDTGDSLLIEASPHDRIWGAGCTFSAISVDKRFTGLNLLGKILMAVRMRLRAEHPEIGASDIVGK